MSCCRRCEQRTDDERVAASAPPHSVDRSPLESASSAEANDALRRTLDDLPERQREAIVLRFFEELSVDETAKAMSCATGTVKATVHQALRQLREKLRQVV